MKHKLHLKCITVQEPAPPGQQKGGKGTRDHSSLLPYLRPRASLLALWRVIYTRLSFWADYICKCPPPHRPQQDGHIQNQQAINLRPPSWPSARSAMEVRRGLGWRVRGWHLLFITLFFSLSKHCLVLIQVLLPLSLPWEQVGIRPKSNEYPLWIEILDLGTAVFLPSCLKWSGS